MPSGESGSIDREIQVELRGNGADVELEAFTWMGTRWAINSMGRRWASGGEQHYLVMVQGDRVFELARSEETQQWWIVRRPEDFGPKRKAM